jgi:hypothetical protein
MSDSTAPSAPSTASTASTSAPSLDDSLRVFQVERTASRTVEEQAVVIVIDTNHLHTLNGTGTAIWDRCDGLSIAGLVEWFAGEFKLSDAVARRDVHSFVNELRAVGALELRES